MHTAIAIFDTDYSMPIQDLARAAEERGFESLWVPEHTHIPTSRKSPFAGGELPEQYKHTLDPFVSLTAAAMVTTRLKLGTGICLVIERDTITTAKCVASVDHVSNGRFLFGVGGGWNREEMEHHGTDFPTRFKRLEEQVKAMKALWTEDAAEYHGKFVDFDAVWSWPKPIQKPHPPIYFGGESGYTLQRVVEIGDGWFPRGRAGAEVVLKGMADLKARAAKAGRDFKTLAVSVFAAKPDAGDLAKLAEGAVTRAIFLLPSEGRDKLLPLLDQYARLKWGA